MNNSQSSVTTCTQTGSTTLTLHLQDYLTPSLNAILSNHWSHLHKHKKRAASALRSALIELLQNSKTSTTLLEEPNLSPINCAMLASFLTMTQPPSPPNSSNPNANTNTKKEQPSKSFSAQKPNHQRTQHNT
jgi:hypothetical protein